MWADTDMDSDMGHGCERGGCGYMDVDVDADMDGEE